MKTNRRHFLRQTGLAAGTLSLAATAPLTSVAAEPVRHALKEPAMKVGLVTYNLAKDWDVETIIKRCEEAKFQGVELRTTHAHKVEVSLNAAQCDEVRKRFADSNVELMGLGSAFDYHTTDKAKLAKDIEATKEYIKLAHDVGASGVKVRPNGLPKEVPVEKTLEQIGRALREVGDFGEGHGVQIRLEVHGQGTSLLPNIRKIIDIASHRYVGVCWNSNDTDLAGDGFDHNFDLVKDKLFTVHLRDLFIENYPFRKLFRRLEEIGYGGYCLAEIPESTDPVRVMKYFRALWLAYQNLL
jgi:sugar phosphate isomerase/epimerase